MCYSDYMNILNPIGAILEATIIQYCVVTVRDKLSRSGEQYTADVL
jgi:hypothetical protein